MCGGLAPDRKEEISWSSAHSVIQIPLTYASKIIRTMAKADPYKPARIRRAIASWFSRPAAKHAFPALQRSLFS